MANGKFVQYQLNTAILCHVAACGLITAGGILTILGRKLPPAAEVGLGLILGGVALSPIATVNGIVSYQITKPKK